MENKKTQHYVDNKKFFEEISIYLKDVKEADHRKKERPPVTHYLGECILKIAERLARKSNFYNYAFRDDMISDAAENCIRYINNFDPQKSKNPFSYFTTISTYAFIRKIAKEEKYSYTKHKVTQNVNDNHGASILQESDKLTWGQDSFAHIGSEIIKKEWSEESINVFVKNYEDKKEEKKKKKNE